MTDDDATTAIATVLCSWSDCAAPATAEVHGQWTIFDFDEWPACDAHWLDVQQAIWRRTVDDQLPVDVWTSWWDK